MTSRGGLTLVEVMVTVAIFSVLSGALFAALNQSRQATRGGDLHIFLQQEARQGLDEFLREVRESDPSTATLTQYTDPLDSRLHQAVAFASARGDPNDLGEGDCLGSTRNDCFHTRLGDASWRSVVVYAFYQTATGEKQLRRYVDFDGVPYTAAVFPFTFQSITATHMTIRSATGTDVVFTRGPSLPTGGSPRVVIAESLEHEDQDGDGNLDANENDGSQSLPDDDADGQLDYGARFALSGRVMTVSLFLRKAQSQASSANRFIVVSLEGSGELRN